MRRLRPDRQVAARLTVLSVADHLIGGGAQCHELSEFYGIVIYMYFADHNPPHFHAIYAEHEVLIRIHDGTTIRGELPRTAMRLVEQWRLCITTSCGELGLSPGTRRPVTDRAAAVDAPSEDDAAAAGNTKQPLFRTCSAEFRIRQGVRSDGVRPLLPPRCELAQRAGVTLDWQAGACDSDRCERGGGLECRVQRSHLWRRLLAVELLAFATIVSVVGFPTLPVAADESSGLVSVVPGRVLETRVGADF